MCESIGHRPLLGRCPKSTKNPFFTPQISSKSVEKQQSNKFENPVAEGWAGAVQQKTANISKKVWINRPTDQRTDTILESHVHEIEHCAGTILKSSKSLQSSIEVEGFQRQQTNQGCGSGRFSCSFHRFRFRFHFVVQILVAIPSSKLEAVNRFHIPTLKPQIWSLRPQISFNKSNGYHN